MSGVALQKNAFSVYQPYFRSGKGPYLDTAVNNHYGFPFRQASVEVKGNLQLTDRMDNILIPNKVCKDSSFDFATILGGLHPIIFRHNLTTYE